MFSLNGTPAEIGRAYGEKCRDGILANLKALVHRVGQEALPRQDKDFRAWMRRQEGLLEKHWPWLLEEIHGVARGCGAQAEDILLLNLRAWQYDLYGRPPAGGCSSLAITLADGTVACAGALDDPAEYYCGPLRFVPENGCRFISFPITGASWGNRGMNSRGLAAGVSSQPLPGLRNLPHAINQDLALRVILQTCATVGEVREFCRTFPFTMNLVCVDAAGAIFCAHQTTAGLQELPAKGFGALTNHVADDALIWWLKEHGVDEFPESPTSRLRRGNLLTFAGARNARCTAREVMDFIGARDDTNPGAIHNKGTIILTFAQPQVEPHILRVMQSAAAGGKAGFEPLSI